MTQQSFVNFGDVMCLNLHQKDGIVIGDGSISNQLFVDDPVRQSRPVHNLQDGSFVLVQRFQYAAKKAYEKALRANTLGLTHKNWRTKLDPTEPLYKNLTEHVRRIVDEKDTNRMEYQRKVGYSVTYGTILQLRHHSSNKFVTQSKNRAEQDRLAMEVSLMDDGTEGSWWKVLPAEKVRSVGDRVQYGDKIVLENAKFGNSYLFVALSNPIVTQESSGNHPYVRLHASSKARYEVNASALTSSFQVRLMRRHEENRSHDSMEVSPTLLGLDVVTLYHRQQDAYLCADAASRTVFWLPSGLWERKEGVQTGARWRIQPANLDGAGGSVKRESPPFVLQHLSSGLYACVEDARVRLTADLHRSKSLWTMKAHSSTRSVGQDSIASGDIVWIREGPKPDGARGWLSVSSSEVEGEGGRVPATTSPAATPNNVDVVELSVRPFREWSSMNHLRASKEVMSAALMCIKDIEPLPADVTDDSELITLAQRQPKLRSTIGAMKRIMVECLSELIRACSRSSTEDPVLRSGPPIKAAQDLIRETGVLELTMQLVVAILDGLRLPLKKIRSDLKEVFTIGQLCYKLIEKACHENPASKIVMAAHINSIMRHSSAEMGAYFAMLEIYSGTRELLEGVSEELFTAMLGVLKKSGGKGARIIHFMTEQCHAGDFPIKGNQDRIAQAVFNDLQHLVFRVDVSSGKALLVDVSEGEDTPSTIDLSDKMEIDESWIDRTDLYSLPDEQQKFVYHLAMIDMMNWCIFGRNEFACTKIEEKAEALGVTYQQLLATISNEGVPPALRQKCCDLMSRIYLDRDPAEPVALFSNTRIWRGALYSRYPDEEGEGGELFPEIRERTKDLDSGADLRRFDDLKQKLLGLFPTNTNVEETQRNRLTLALLGVLGDLVKFGHYHHYDQMSLEMLPDFRAIREVSPVLLYTLDGRTDFCAPFGNFGPDEARFEESAKTHIVMKVKLKVLNILSGFFQCAQTERISRFARFWERMLERLDADKDENWDDIVKTVILARGNSTQDFGASPQPSPASASGLSNGAVPGSTIANNKVVPSSNFVIKDYIADNKRWETAPPWTARDLKELADHLFGREALISREFSASGIAAMFNTGNFWFVPDWIKMLLDLVRYQNSELKEQAVFFLLASFSQHPNFIRLVKSSLFVWERDMAVLFFRARGDVSRIRSLKSAIRSNVVESMEQGCAAAQEVLHYWTETLAQKHAEGPDKGLDLQKMVASLGAMEAVVMCLHAPLFKDDGSVHKWRKTLFQHVYDFLGQLCLRNEALQGKLLPYWDVLCQHVSVLNPESVLRPMLHDNAAVIDAVGPRAIKMVFGALRSQTTRRAGWLLILPSLVKCKGKAIKENQALVMSEFRKSEESVALLMKTAEEWDTRIAYMGSGEYFMACGGSQLKFHLAVVRLLAESSMGKNPAAEVYAANYLCLRDVVRVLLRANVTSSGELTAVNRQVLADVKKEFVNFLHHVYIDTAVTRLLEELTREGNGMWSIDRSEEEELGGKPLMASLRDDINAFADMCREPDKVCKEELVATGEYVCGVVMPTLAAYFHKVYGKVREEDTAGLAHEVFDAAKQIFEVPLPQAVQKMEVHDESIFGRRPVWKLLDVMARKARIGVEWHRNPRNSTFVEDEAITNRRERLIAEDVVATSFLTGYQTLVKEIALRFGIIDTEKLIGDGMLQITMMFCREGQVPLYEDFQFLPLGRNTPQNPKYYDFVMAMLEISRSPTTDATILRDILRIVRAMVYVLEPGQADRTVEQCMPQWRAFLGFEPAVKEGKCQKPKLRWVQDRLDAMGATVAGMRLLKNDSRMVRLPAAALLVSLLQGTNRRVQATLHGYLAAKKDAIFFKVVAETLDVAMEGLKEHKRQIKIAIRTNSSTTSRSARSASSRSGNLDEELRLAGGFGKSSMVMVTLRLLQLMCKGQYKPLQDMLLRQPLAAHPVNVAQKLVDMLEAMQPLINDSLSFRDGEIAMLAVQLLDTIAELLQGPNEANQRFVLGSSFLAVANRMFSSTFYAPIGDDNPQLHDSSMSANDVRAHLKVALLGACQAMLEGAAAKEPQYLLKMLEYFESRNLYMQVVECGRVLGLTAVVEERSENGADVEDGFGFGSQSSKMGSISSKSSGSVGMIDGLQTGRSTAASATGATARRSEQQGALKFAHGFEKTVEKELFGFYCLMLGMVEYERGPAAHAMLQKLRELGSRHKALRSYLERHTGEVEISRRNRSTGRRIVEKVRFRVDQNVKLLTEGRGFIAKAEEEMFDVPRDNPQEKAKAFVKKLLALRDNTHWLLYVGETATRRFLIRNRDLINQTPFSLAALITLCLLLFYGVPMDPNTGGILGNGMFFPLDQGTQAPAGYGHERYPWPQKTSDPDETGAWYGSVLSATDLSVKFRMSLVSRWDSEAEFEMFPLGKLILYLLGALHLGFSALNAFIYMVQELPLVIRGVIERHRVHGASSSSSAAALALLGIGSSHTEGTTGGGSTATLRGSAYLEDPPAIPTEPAVDLMSPGLQWDLFWACRMLMYHGLLCSLSMLGMLSSPLFYVFMTIDFFRMRDGRLVLQAVIYGAPNLFRSFVLGIIVLVCLGFYSYAYFSHSVNISQELCHSPFQCVSKHILDSMTGDLTTVLGDDFGGFAYPALAVWKDSWNAWRSLFVFCSIIFWVFLLQGIIQGQIIDAFAEKRNQDAYLRDDLEKKCFVSSIDRFVFNAYPGEWEKRRGGKYAWQYLLFFTYLSDKDEEEYNGLENEVSQAFEQGDIDFLPIEQLAARQHDEMQEPNEDNKIITETLQHRVHGLEGEVSSLKQIANKILNTLRDSTPPELERASSSYIGAAAQSPRRTSPGPGRGLLGVAIDNARREQEALAAARSASGGQLAPMVEAAPTGTPTSAVDNANRQP